MECFTQVYTELLVSNSVINKKKLVPNFIDKKKYVVHYRNLKLYLSLGIKLKKVHRIRIQFFIELEFNENPWLEPYIHLITELRKKVCIRK